LADAIDDNDHIFRYVGGSAIDGDFIEPAAFRRKKKQGALEAGLSVNWVEWFQTSTPQEAVRPLRDVFVKKNFTVGPTSRFALLNVGDAKTAAAKWTTIAIVSDEQPDDASHALVTHYDEAFNDQVAEQLAKAIIASYPTKPT
jgi:hypothetical protein